ncbi:MAG: hypothetical protein HF978_16530 [Desulfobacteraceae bacterium]|nr:hypothetical protein [Desulfobacteraceae bacterium]MBC2757150.1 hypothetical protein [Desulfobacteraceae bacterium]
MHQTNKWTIASIIFVLMFPLSCAKHIPEQRFVNDNAKFDLLIGGLTSEFKEGIVSRLVERYKDQGNVDLVNFDKLNQVQCSDYDVILVMDSVQAWSLFNFSLKSFLKKTENCNNVVLLFTANDPEWEYQYNDLDAITSASMVDNEDRVFNELAAKIDVMISKI